MRGIGGNLRVLTERETLANGVANANSRKLSERARTGCERVASTLYLFESCFEKTYGIVTEARVALFRHHV